MRVPGKAEHSRYIRVLALPNRIDPGNLVRKESERDQDTVLDHLSLFSLKDMVCVCVCVCVLKH